jgi:hypothetical protein
MNLIKNLTRTKRKKSTTQVGNSRRVSESDRLAMEKWAAHPEWIEKILKASEEYKKERESKENQR